MERIAIIDLGSNSVRLVIMEINDRGAYRIINEVKETVRLSEGMGADNILKPDAIRRTMQTLRLFKNLCEASDITDTIAVATAAVRKARNQQEFLQLIQMDTGISFEVISGVREAELGFKGVVHTLDIEDGFVVDIGGASTEVTKFIDRKIVEAFSFPFGAVNLTEMFLEKNSNTQKQIDALEKFLTKQYTSIPWLRNNISAMPLIGLGGTIRALSKIDRMKKGYSLDVTHNYRMNNSDIEAIYNSMKYMNLEERLLLPGMAKDRADIIIAGTSAVNMLLKVLRASRFIISGSGIREGMFYEHYLHRLSSSGYTNIINASIDNILKLYNVNLSHVEQVKKIALTIFDQLGIVHKLGKEHRIVLERAALLHDVGIIIDFYNRDEHTYYILTNSRINGLDHKEIILTALAASKFTGEKLRRHYVKHRDIISKEDYSAVRKLIAILMISDKLDRSKASIITSVDCRIKADKVILATEKLMGEGELEVAEANKMQGIFKKTFRKDLVIT